MDANGHIYRIPEGEMLTVSEQRRIDEDKARLEGYLMAREDVDRERLVREIELERRVH